MNLRQIVGAAVVALSVVASAASASATVITSLSGGTSVAIPGVNQFGVGPQVIAATSTTPTVTWSSTSPSSIFGYTSGWGLAGNGSWNGALGPYIGAQPSPAGMTLAFSSGISAVGMFMNYAPGYGAATISVYDLSNQLIESLVLNISTPGAVNGGAFFGFSETGNVIGSFVLSGAYIVATDLKIAVSESNVPAPGALALLGLGLFGLGGLRRRKAA